MTSQNARPGTSLHGVERETLGVQMINCAPSTLRFSKFKDMNEGQLQSGTRVGVGQTAEIFRKISSEMKAAKLMALKDNFFCPSSHAWVSFKKLRRSHFVAFFTEIGIRLYHTLSKTSTIFCDATGTIVFLKQLGPQKRLLYYGIVNSSPEKNRPPVAVSDSRPLCIVSFRTFIASCYIDDNVESSLKYLNSRLKGLNKVDDISVQFIESESVEVDECLGRGRQR